MYIRVVLACFMLNVLLTSVSAKTVVPKRKEHAASERNSNLDKEVLFHGIQEEEVENDDMVFKLPLAEQKARLKKLVEKKIDVNQDGYVDRNELEAWTLKALDDFETEDTRKDFPSIDKNIDELISWEEYVKDTFGDDFSEETEEFKNPDTKEWKNFVASYKKDKKLFNVCDKDKNGQLDLKEYVIFKHPSHDSEAQNVLVEDILRTTDLNKDGGIDLKEFLGDFKKKMDQTDPEWTEMETEKFNDEFDHNGDGKLTGDEIVSWIAMDNKEEAEEEAKHLISECDRNSDRKLSVAEILGNHELWLESDATDMGRQLLRRHDEL